MKTFLLTLFAVVFPALFVTGWFSIVSWQLIKYSIQSNWRNRGTDISTS